MPTKQCGYYSVEKKYHYFKSHYASIAKDIKKSQKLLRDMYASIAIWTLSIMQISALYDASIAMDVKNPIYI